MSIVSQLKTKLRLIEREHPSATLWVVFFAESHNSNAGIGEIKGNWMNLPKQVHLSAMLRLNPARQFSDIA